MQFAEHTIQLEAQFISLIDAPCEFQFSVHQGEVQQVEIFSVQTGEETIYRDTLVAIFGEAKVHAAENDLAQHVQDNLADYVGSN